MSASDDKKTQPDPSVDDSNQGSGQKTGRKKSKTLPDKWQSAEKALRDHISVAFMTRLKQDADLREAGDMI